MRDAQADLGRRAWVACPRCADAGHCATCRAGNRCERHWCYLLGTEWSLLFVQCHRCWYRWWYDSGFGAGHHPAG